MNDDSNSTPPDLDHGTRKGDKTELRFSHAGLVQLGQPNPTTPAPRNNGLATTRA